MTGPDSSGDAWYSIKVPVTSKAEKCLSVRVVLLALDKEGFELASVRLSAFVPVGKTVVLTARTYMADKHLRSVAKWALQSVSAEEKDAPQVTLTDVKTKVLSDPDNSGDISFTVKADIQNQQDVPARRITLQAIDSEGFELYKTTLAGSVEARASGTLTKKTYMPYKDFKAIASWRLVNN
jgi:flagellar hook assembly protein FlgD